MSGRTLSSRSPMGMDQDTAHTKSLHFLSSKQSFINDAVSQLSIPESDGNVTISELSHHTKFHNDSQEGNNNCAYCNMYKSSPKRKWHESDQNLISKELDHGSKRISEDKTSLDSVEYKPSLNELDASSRPLSEKVVKENGIHSSSHNHFSQTQSLVVTALFQETAPATITRTPSNFISTSPLPLTAQDYSAGSEIWSVHHPIKRPPPPLPPSSSSILGSPPACSRRRSRAPEFSSLGSTFPTIREISGAAGVAPSSYFRSLLSDSHDQDHQERSKTKAESAFDGDHSGVAEPMSSLSVGKAVFMIFFVYATANAMYVV